MSSELRNLDSTLGCLVVAVFFAALIIWLVLGNIDSSLQRIADKIAPEDTASEVTLNKIDSTLFGIKPLDE